VTAFRADIPPHVAAVIRHLPPDLKRGVKEAIRALCGNPAIGIPLLRDLEGLWKYRVRRYRIVYGVDRARRILRIVAVGHRRSIYEDAAARVSRPGATGDE